METKSVRSIRLQFDFKQVKRITLFSVDFSTKEVAEKCLSNLDKRFKAEVKDKSVYVKNGRIYYSYFSEGKDQKIELEFK